MQECAAAQIVSNTAVVDRRALIERISRTWAVDSAVHARVLASQDPSWQTEVLELAGGFAVLCGRGLYVNRALGWGLAGPVAAADFDVLEERSEVVRRVPSVDIVPTADRTVIELAARARLRDLAVHDDTRPTAGSDMRNARVIRRSWSSAPTASCSGCGRTSRPRDSASARATTRRASDAFAKAAAAVVGERFPACPRPRRRSSRSAREQPHDP